MNTDSIQTQKVWVIEQQGERIRCDYEFRSTVEVEMYKKDSDFFN